MRQVSAMLVNFISIPSHFTTSFCHAIKPKGTKAHFTSVDHVFMLTFQIFALTFKNY